MTNTVLPITPAIAEICTTIDQSICAFIATCRDYLPPLGKYEAEVEALNLFKMAIRNAEGVIELARRDLVLLPPALAAARACFETAVKAAWLVDTDNQFDRERRWLAHLASEERYLKRIADRLEESGLQVEELRQREEDIRQFRLSIAIKLPQGVALLGGTPSFESMLAGLGGEKLYTLYLLLSQSVHGEHAGTWLYRSGGVGTKKELGEFVKPNDWLVPLRLCFLSLSHPARVFLVRLGVDSDRFLTDAACQGVEEQISKIAEDNSRPRM